MEKRHIKGSIEREVKRINECMAHDRRELKILELALKQLDQE